MSNFDPEQRELCPDGTCIGLVGADGRCKECGARGKAPAQASPATEEPPPEDSAPEEHEPMDEPAHEADDDFDARQLCPDGLCIGVIGPKGRCNECGTTLSAS